MTNPPATETTESNAAPGDVSGVAPIAVPSPGLGRVALIAAICLFVGSVIASIVLGTIGAPYVDRSGPTPSFSFNTGDDDPVTSLLGLLSPLHAVVGTLVGLWVIVQSIVAMAANRGRRQAIFALVLGVLTPGISLVVYLLIMLLPR